MIKIDNISLSYGNKQIFKNFSLTVKPHSRICLFGESGCGKTTLLRLMLLLEAPDAGSVTIPKGTKLSAVFQEDRLLPFMTILENILLVGASPHTATENLDALGIGAAAQQNPHGLSGGMRRRAALARALSADFDYLILDEPFAGLDEANIKSAAAQINKVAGNRTIIMVSHSKAEAALLDAEIVNL